MPLSPPPPRRPASPSHPATAEIETGAPLATPSLEEAPQGGSMVATARAPGVVMLTAQVPTMLTAMETIVNR